MHQRRKGLVSCGASKLTVPPRLAYQSRWEAWDSSRADSSGGPRPVRARACYLQGSTTSEAAPVLSAGPTPHTALEDWDFMITGEVGEPVRLAWREFQDLPHEEVTVDIHCVTKWSKFGTTWSGSPSTPCSIASRPPWIMCWRSVTAATRRTTSRGPHRWPGLGCRSVRR
jgi:hypothetical protein